MFDVRPFGEVVTLTVTHEEFPKGQAGVFRRDIGQGWPGILSSLKTLLESGEPRAFPAPYWRSALPRADSRAPASAPARCPAGCAAVIGIVKRARGALPNMRHDGRRPAENRSRGAVLMPTSR